MRKLIFAGHAMDIGPALPIGKGRKVEVDVSTEKRPRGAPDTLVLCLFLRGSEAYDLRGVIIARLRRT